MQWFADLTKLRHWPSHFHRSMSFYIILTEKKSKMYTKIMWTHKIFSLALFWRKQFFTPHEYGWSLLIQKSTTCILLQSYHLSNIKNKKRPIKNYLQLIHTKNLGFQSYLWFLLESIHYLNPWTFWSPFHTVFNNLQNNSKRIPFMQAIWIKITIMK